MLTAIGEKAFRGYKDLTSVTIPDSVTEISSWAFENCTSLTVRARIQIRPAHRAEGF